MAGKLRVRFEGTGRSARPFAKFQRGAKRGMAGKTGRAVAGAMRLTATDSIQSQFRQQRTVSVAGGSAWERTKPFGECNPPQRTLYRTGALQRAWTGQSSDSITEIRRGRVSVGAGGSVGIRAVVFQRAAPTRVRAKRRTRGGKLAMQLALGLGPCKVWISEGKLLSGLVIPSRPVGMSRGMLRAASRVVLRSVATGGERVDAGFRGAAV